MTGRRKIPQFKIFLLIFLLLLAVMMVTLNRDRFFPGKTALTYTGYGACRTVSGSLHLIEIDGARIILDAGSFFGDEGRDAPELSPEVVEEVDGVIISHAHIDHCGRLPILHRLGYRGPIYMTAPTARLLPVMLRMKADYADYGQEEYYYSVRSRDEACARETGTPVHTDPECKWGVRIHDENRRTLKGTRAELGDRGFYLCRVCISSEVDEVLKGVVTRPPGESFPVAPGVEAGLYGTPHIPGSVMIRLEGEEGGALLYTGDFGSGVSPHLPPQEGVEGFSWAIVEGTYGPGEEVLDPGERRRFREFIGRKVEAGWRVIIPAFVLDRTQQVLAELSRGREEGLIPEGEPPTLFSPTAAEISRIYRTEFTAPEYGPYFSCEFFEFASGGAEFSSRTWDGRVGKGEVVVCSPGMADGGYAGELIEKYASDPETVFIFVGYVCGDSPGGRLYRKAGEEGEPLLELEGGGIPVRARAESFSRAFSGHGRFEQLRDFLMEIEGLQGIIIVHADGGTSLELGEAYEEAFPELEVIVPEVGWTYELN